MNILGRLDPEEILYIAQRVCTTWRSVCCEPSLWRVFNMKYSSKFHTIDFADSVCRRAVDLSQGQLKEINIKRFGTDDLLRYISERLNHLKILSLDTCHNITPQGLTTAVQNFPALEELHLRFIPSIRALDIEAIGISCPMLKSFKFNDYLRQFHLIPKDIIDNSYALSIAKTMPNLLRLLLVYNRMDNEGLLAILDCCPNIELLDISHSYCVDLKCDIGRRCSRQIREFRRHSFPYVSNSYHSDSYWYHSETDSDDYD